MIWASISIFLLIVVVITDIGARWKRQRQRAYRRYVDAFFDAAERILSDPNAPPCVMSTIGFVADVIDDDRVAYSFFRVIREKNGDVNPELHARLSREQVEIDAYQKVNPDGLRDYHEALANGLLAIAQLDGFYALGIHYAFGRLSKRHPDVGATVVRDASLRMMTKSKSNHLAHV